MADEGARGDDVLDERRDDLRDDLREETVGVYVHVPFCERVCPYCDFAVVAARGAAPGSIPPARETRYVDALLRELEARRPAFAGRRLASVYLGGGTPSLLRPASLERIVGAVRRAFPPPAPAAAPVEITLEANPSTTERERLPAFRAAGVTRLSVGVQSFDDTTLRRLGRAHRAAEAHAFLAAARAAGFDAISCDLLFAAPGQDEAALEGDLDALLAAAPEHVSAYALSLEPDTPFGRAAAAGRLPVPDDDAAGAMLRRVRERLAAAGLAPYEVSSYARPGHRAVHNRRYWARAPVLGIGVGAASSEPRGPAAPFGARRTNERAEGAWLARVEAGAAGGPAPGGLEVLDGPTARGEAVWLALRTGEGLAAAAFAREFGAAPRAFFGEAIEELVGAGWLAESPAGDLRLREAAWPLADAVFARFV